MPLIHPLEDAIQPRSMVTTPTPMGKSHFALDTSGLASVFGGPEAIFSLALVHVYTGRRWLGWYNSPGSYFLGKLLARIAHESPILDIISNSGDRSERRPDAAELFNYDGQKGPKFRGIYSGTMLDETGHLAALFVKECAEVSATIIPGRQTRPTNITIANLDYPPPTRVSLARFRTHTRASIGALVPIIVSCGACTVCGYYRDWYCFSVISLGIIVNGLSCLVIGSGELIFTHPVPQPGLPLGDGFLTTPEQIILLKGPEGAVNSVTRGRFSLRFDNGPLFRSIGVCAILLMLQSVAQLLLVPQGSLFGQLMFVASIVVSWLYNLWLSSLDKEKIQRDMLMHILRHEQQRPSLTKFTLGTRTSMAVFATLASDNKEKAREILDYLLPNNTGVWQNWKSTIVDRLDSGRRRLFDESDWSGSQDSQEERLLKMLYRDAQDAYEGFPKTGLH